MARPVRTGWMDVVYHGPTAEIGDLWCARERPGEIHSVWEPTEQERALLTLPGRSGVLTRLRGFFRDHGWALALHGSCVRDLDFVAVPWIQRFPTQVGTLVAQVEKEFDRLSEGPTWKPHGRIAYAFHPREWEDERPKTWDISFVDPRNAIERGFG